MLALSYSFKDINSWHFLDIHLQSRNISGIGEYLKFPAFFGFIGLYLMNLMKTSESKLANSKWEIKKPKKLYTQLNWHKSYALVLLKYLQNFQMVCPLQKKMKKRLYLTYRSPYCPWTTTWGERTKNLCLIHFLCVMYSNHCNQCMKLIWNKHGLECSRIWKLSGISRSSSASKSVEIFRDRDIR